MPALLLASFLEIHDLPPVARTSSAGAIGNTHSGRPAAA